MRHIHRYHKAKARSFDMKWNWLPQTKANEVWTRTQKVWLWKVAINEKEWNFRNEIVQGIWTCGQTLKTCDRIWMNITFKGQNHWVFEANSKLVTDRYWKGFLND